MCNPFKPGLALNFPVKEDFDPVKSIFNGISREYESARPSYPDELVRDLTREAGIGPDSRILEIGIGTGKLTEMLAKKELNITGIELGDNMAKIARKNLKAFPNVEIIVGNFNTYEFNPASFDAVIAATSYHWLDPETRTARIASLLRPAGAAAIVDTGHIDRGMDNFPVSSQKCYMKWDRNTTGEYRLPSLEEAEKEGFRRKNEFGGDFEPVFMHSYGSDIIYTTITYTRLLVTYSGVVSMDGKSRQGLLDCLGEMIDTEFGGKITKSYLWQLFMARKK